MTSSKFAHRVRSPVPPHICHPPPPPPGPWPPNNFAILWDMSWPLEEGSDGFLITIGATYQGELWEGTTVLGANHYHATYHLHSATQTAELYLNATHNDQDVYAEALTIPITWETTTPYHITSWDNLFPANASAAADYLF